jgi:hypothetical protein
MFKEIKKYGLIDKIIIIIMANLKNDVKFDSGDECKGVCICAPKYNTSTTFYTQNFNRIRCHRLKYK